jgi:hypothetical protein
MNSNYPPLPDEVPLDPPMRRYGPLDDAAEAAAKKLRVERMWHELREQREQREQRELREQRLLWGDGAGQQATSFSHMHVSGVKNDAGKYRPGLVLGGFANALLAVSVVGTDGAKKYTDGGWKIVPNGEARYVDAALRHLLDDLRGYKVDSDSGSLHLAHAAWNLLAVIELRSEHPCP